MEFLNVCLGYGVESIVPWQRQKRDEDAQAHSGQVAEHQPAGHLADFRRARPSVDPGGGVGSSRLGAAAGRGGDAPHPIVTAGHLK